MLLSYIDGVSESQNTTTGQEYEHNISLISNKEEVKEMLKTYKKAIFRQKGNSWELRYRRDGYEVSFSAHTQKECKEKFDKWYKTKKKTVTKKSKVVTVLEWYEQWMETYKRPKVAESTLKSINYICNNFIKVIGDKDITKVTHIELQQIIYNMSAKGNTRHKVKTYLGDMFRHALLNNIVKVNVAINLSDNSQEATEGRALTRDEQLQLMQCNKDTLLKKYYIYTMLTGCRRNEALALLPEHILGDRIMIIQTKPKHMIRYIPLFEDIKKLLSTIKMTAGEKVFNYNHDYVTRQAKNYLPNEHVIKDLRTTFATNCNELGIDVKVIQKWMGHKSDFVTKNNYIKVLDKYEQEQAEKLTSIFPNFSPKNET